MGLCGPSGAMCHRRIASELEMGSFPTVMSQIQATRDPVISTAVTSMAGSHTAQRSQSGVQQGASTTPHQPSVTPRTRAARLLNASPMQLPGETSFHKRLFQLKKTWNSPKSLPAVFVTKPSFRFPNLLENKTLL